MTSDSGFVFHLSLLSLGVFYLHSLQLMAEEDLGVVSLDHVTLFVSVCDFVCSVFATGQIF